MPLTADRESYYRHSVPDTTREVIVWALPDRGRARVFVEAHDRNESAGVNVCVRTDRADADALVRSANDGTMPLAILADWIEDHADWWWTDHISTVRDHAAAVAFVARWLREVDLAPQA